MADLLTPQQFHDYQKSAVIHQLTHDDSMLWLGMGLGKTVITETTIVDRMRAGLVQKTLIFGPLRVIQAVWAREARKWTHTKHLRFSVIHGDPEKRLRALFTDSDIYLCNYENMNWLAQQLDHYYLSRGLPLPFQMVVYDEVSKLKNSTAVRVSGGNRDRKDKRGEMYKVKLTGWRKMIPHFKYRSGLTGTPAANGYLDLHGQYLAVDGGTRLGEFVTHFKDSYFTSDYNGWKYTPTDLGRQWIEHKISDITLKMDAKDYLDMPVVNYVNMMVDLPARAAAHYKEVEKQLFTRFESGREIELFSKSSVSNKCLQICNGSPYTNGTDITDGFESVHDAKLDALESVLEEAAGKPVLCSYSFVSDAKRIMKHFAKYKPVNLTEIPSTRTEKVINDWNAGKIRLMIGHPACLHPSTQVLTELRGWVRLIDVTKEDRVFDGVEFVTHDGCSYSGYKEVIAVFGVVMTPNHKLLIDNNWMEAKDVGTDRNIKRKALYEYQGNDSRIGEMLKLPARINDVDYAVEPGNDGRRSGGRCESVTLRERETGTEKSHVYDLVNCGPRNRFLIRNDDGEVFISHNSMGHGIDGLQESGGVVVWFGMPWSLEYYMQMNARIDRQGQKEQVTIIHILCRDTVDLVVADAISRKTDDQEGLKAAMQRYRDGLTTNDLDVNFF